MKASHQQISAALEHNRSEEIISPWSVVKQTADSLIPAPPATALDPRSRIKQQQKRWETQTARLQWQQTLISDLKKSTKTQEEIFNHRAKQLSESCWHAGTLLTNNKSDSGLFELAWVFSLLSDCKTLCFRLDGRRQFESFYTTATTRAVRGIGDVQVLCRDAGDRVCLDTLPEGVISGAGRWPTDRAWLGRMRLSQPLIHAVHI